MRRSESGGGESEAMREEERVKLEGWGSESGRGRESGGRDERKSSG